MPLPTYNQPINYDNLDEWEDLPLGQEQQVQNQYDTDEWEDLPLGQEQQVQSQSEATDSSFFDRISESWKTGKSQTQLGQLRYRQLLGEETGEIEQEIADLKTAMPKPDKIKRGLPEQAVSAVAEMIPTQLAGMEKGVKRGVALGTGFAGITALAGQAGPQAAFPEEIITVPAAFAGGYGVGMLSGTIESIGQIEAGLAYDELLNLKDEAGNTIEPVIAKSAAASVGIINGLIEASQIKLLLKTIPGGEAVLRGAINKTLKNAIKNKTLKSIALKTAGKYGKFIGAETAQEVVQESTNILAAEIAKEVNNKLKGTDIKPATAKEIADRLIETAKQSALAFGAMGIPGTAVSGGIEAGRLKKDLRLDEQAKHRTINAIKMIDEGMATNQVMGEAFTPEDAIEVIREEYNNRTLTDNDLDQLKEKHPRLQAGLTNIIGDNIVARVDKDIKDAERIRRTIEAQGDQERVDRETKEKIHLWNIEKKRVDAEKRAKKATALKLAKEKEIAAKEPVKFIGIRKTSKGEFPVFEGKSGFQIDYDPARHEISNTDEYNAAKLQIGKPADEKPSEATEKKFEAKPILRQGEIIEAKIKPDKKVIVYKNPTDSQAQELRDRFKEEYPDTIKGEPKTRSTYDSEGNEYRWMAGDATHPMVEIYIKDKLGVETNQSKVLLEPIPKREMSQEVWEDLTLKQYERMPIAERDRLTEKFQMLPKLVVVEPTLKPAPKPSKIRTLRGAIKELGGIDFLNYTGELKDLEVSAKKSISKKGGTGIDQAVEQLIDNGWLDKDTTVASFLEELRTNPKVLLSRDRIGINISEKKSYELSAQEKRLKKQLEYEPETPPEDQYITMNAEDLPVGKKMTLLENKTSRGWDIYEILDTDDPFEVVLQDGEKVILNPLDRVQVAKKDISDRLDEPKKDIFVRKPTAKEKKGGKARSDGFLSIPDKEGYENIYKPYGEKGVGYYYRDNKYSLKGVPKEDIVKIKTQRFETGKKLTSKERKKVMRSIVDVYKENNAPKESKGIDSRGEEIFGYAYSPDYFETSDITGKKIRHYISLPDDRIAHPSELFPEITEAKIKQALIEEAEETKLKNLRKEELLERASKATNINEANAEASKVRLSTLPNWSEDSVALKNESGNFIRLISPEDISILKDAGFVETRASWETKELGRKPPKFYKVIINAPDGRFDTKILRGGIDKKTAEHEAKIYREQGMIVSIMPEIKQSKDKGKPYEKPAKVEEAQQVLPITEGKINYTEKDIKTEFPQVVSDRAGSYKSGVRTIISPADAAAFAHMNLSKYPQEHFVSIILDKNNDIISAHRYSIGTSSQAHATPHVIAGHALNTPDAANVVFVHNHPSGSAKLSEDDVKIFRFLQNTLRGTKIKARDMIAVAEKEYSSYLESPSRSHKIPEVKAKYRIPMVERVFKSKGNNLYKIMHENDVRSFGKNNLPDGGLILLNHQNNVVGTLPIDDYSLLREGISENILKQTEATNATNIIAYNPKIKITEASEKNLKKFTNATYLLLLDIIDKSGSRQARGAMPSTTATKFFSTKTTKPQNTLTKQDLKDIFEPMKNVRTGITKAGNFYFGVEGKPAIEIFEVDYIKGYIHTSGGKIPDVTGSFSGDTIELKTSGVGPTADVGTVWHEFTHYIETNNILTSNDIKALDAAIGKDNVTAEDRANYIGNNLADWQSQKNLRIKRILKKIANFINAVWELASRTRTARGVLRDVKSGKILSKKEVAGINKLAQSGTLYQMAGGKAVGAPTGALVKAQDMLEEGKSKKEIWRETGWWLGAENRWKFEIDDSKAIIKNRGDWLSTLTNAKNEKVRLSTILDHKKLYGAYPDIANILVQLRDWRIPKNNTGAYNYRTNSIEISRDLTHEEFRGTLFHEIAHAIQELEGFAKGGTPSPNYFFQDIVKKTELKRLKTDGIKEANRRINSAKTQSEYEAMREERKILVQTIKELERDPDVLKPYEVYIRLAGEIEARDVASRIKLTARQRKEQLPYESQGIPEDQWIIKDASGTSFSIKPAKQFQTKPGKDYKELLKRYQESQKQETIKSDEDTIKAYKEKHIAFDPKKFKLTKESAKDFIAKVYTKFVFNEFPALRLAAKSKDPKVIQRIQDQINRVWGKGGIIEVFVAGKGPHRVDAEGTPKYIEGVQSLKDIVKDLNKQEYEDYEALRIAERDVALARFRPDIKGTDLEASMKLIKAIENKYGEGIKKLRDISKAQRQYDDTLLKLLVEEGWTSKKVYEAIKSKPESEFYASFLREMDTVGEQIHGGKDPLKRIKGSELRKIPSIESSITNTYKTIKLLETIKLNKRIVELKDLTSDLAEVIEEVKPQFITKDMPDRPGPRGGTKVSIKSPIQPKNTIIVPVNGVKHYWKVPPDVHKAIDYYSPQEISMAIKILSAPARLLRAGATLTAEFIMRNPVRDQFSAMVYSKYGYVPFLDFGKGLFELFKKGDLYQEFKAGGGEQSYFTSMDRTTLNMTAKDVLGFKKGLRTYNPIEYLRIVSEATEKATRLGVFKRAKSKGATTPEATAAARESTLDFRRIGEERRINQIIAFWNANIQGTDILRRKIQKNPGQTLLRLTLGITVPSIAIWFFNNSDDERREKYQSLPGWRKNFFWNIIIDKDTPIISLPKPFELGLIFGSLPERILDYISLNDPKAFKEIGTSIKEGATPGIIPTAALPLIENMANWSFFMKRPLESETIKRLPAGQRAHQYTSDVLRRFGKATDISPIKMENWIRGWTGGLGKLGLDIADIPFKDRNIPEVGKHWYETMPGIRGFVSKDPIGGAGKDINSFYESLEKITEAEQGFKILRKTSVEEALRFDTKTRGIKRFATSFRKASLRLGKLRKRKAVVMQSRSYTSDQKREMIDRIDGMMTKIAKYNNGKLLLYLQTK